MKKIATILTVLTVGFSFSFGASDSEEFFYKRGYESGYNKGFDEGVNKGLESAKLVIEKYKAEIEAYEVGKYLIKSKKLTYPQVWQERDLKGGIRLVVTKSEIVDELNIDSIFSKFLVLPQRENTEIATLDDIAKNSVYLSERDTAVHGIPTTADREQNIVTLSLEKSWKNEDILKKANVVYSEAENRYNIIFFSIQEKRDFCRSFKVCAK